MYVLDTVHNDCNKINLWAGTAWPTGTTGEHFFLQWERSAVEARGQVHCTWVRSDLNGPP